MFVPFLVARGSPFVWRCRAGHARVPLSSCCQGKRQKSKWKKYSPSCLMCGKKRRRFENLSKAETRKRVSPLKQLGACAGVVSCPRDSWNDHPFQPFRTAANQSRGCHPSQGIYFQITTKHYLNKTNTYIRIHVVRMRRLIPALLLEMFEIQKEQTPHLSTKLTSRTFQIQ